MFPDIISILSCSAPQPQRDPERLYCQISDWAVASRFELLPKSNHMFLLPPQTPL